MKLTTKILKEMIRKELKENAFGKKGGYYARHSLGAPPAPDGFDKESYRETNQYAVALEQMEDYYYDYLDGSGASEEEVKKELANNFYNNNNIPNEMALQLLVSDFMADM